MPPDCRPQGDADLYGVGVRIGIYAQWLATLLTTLFDKRQEDAFRVANLIISASVLLGLCIESRPGRTPVVGAVITQYLLAGSLSSLTGDGVSHLASLTGLARLLFYLALSAYGVWFWFDGVDQLSAPACAAHDIAFFGRVSVHAPWFRRLGKAASCAGLVLCVALIGLGARRLLGRLRGGGGVEGGLLEDRRKRRAQEPPRVEVALLALSAALVACCVYLVEHLVRVNEVQGVNAGGRMSVGQLIPLLAGAVACGLTLWNVLVHRLFLRRRCWFLFRRHI